MDDRDPCERIRQYGLKAKRGEIACVLDACPHCRGEPGSFRRHGVRLRLFLVFAEELVKPVFSYLTRWKCPLCERTFTLYPDFALPFKRYVLAFIRERCAAYVEDKARTYRQGIEEEGAAVAYWDADSGTALWPSTLWRWVGSLGHFPVTVHQALNLIKQQDPSTDLFRALGRIRIRAGKFRSEGRKRLLEGCREWVTVDRDYMRMFSVSVFPDLATRCCWS